MAFCALALQICVKSAFKHIFLCVESKVDIGLEQKAVMCVLRAVLCATHTLHGMQYTHHSLKYLLPQRRISYNDVFLLIKWSIPQYCSFSKAQHKLPEDGPIEPKHVGANREIF